MYLVGLTGSMGCGKSTVSRLFAECGARVLDADLFARLAVEPGSPGFDKVIAEFGKEMIDDGGALDREALGRVVFGDPEKRRALEGIVHPEVRRLQGQSLALFEKKEPLGVVILDVPLLFETGGEARCDASVAVLCGDVQMDRLVERTGMSDAVKRAAIDRQMPEAEKRRLADHLVDNAGTLEQTAVQVDDLWRLFKTKAKNGEGAAWPKQWQVEE